MIRETVHALLACVVTFFICAVTYPAAVWGLGQLVFPRQAEGSLVYDSDGTLVGSELIAQPFASDTYFFPRPSAVDYKADAAGGSNLGTQNPDLRKKVVERAQALKASESNPAPVDLVTASGGGMDPHISPAAAYFQVARVAAARKLPVAQVKALVARAVERSGLVIGAPPRVNVLRLNLELNAAKPPPAADDRADTVTAPETVVAGRHEGIAARIGEIAGRLQTLGARIDAIARDEADHSATHEAIKALDERLVKISAGTRDLPRLVERIEDLDGRVGATGASVERLRFTVRETREAIDAVAGRARNDGAGAADAKHQGDRGPGTR